MTKQGSPLLRFLWGEAGMHAVRRDPELKRFYRRKLVQVEELAGQAGLQILQAILENEVTRRVGPPHRPNPSAGCVRWGKQPG